MRHLERIEFSVKDIVTECASSFRDETLKGKYISSAEYIEQKSQEYVAVANNNDWPDILPHETVNMIISKDEMVKLYDRKFVIHPEVRAKYYDKILANAKSGKCPICGIGQASTLDHYLAKTLYPTYSVTPDNLIPACKDCNTNKGNIPVDSKHDAPLHPYFDDVDNIVWLCAAIVSKNDILVAQYYVNPEIEKADVGLYARLCAHLKLYKLKHAYSVQAATEISENTALWQTVYRRSGENGLLQYLSECLCSCEMVQKNTWKTALLRGLLDAVKDNIFKES